MSKAVGFLQITAENFLFFYRISNDKNFIPNCLDNAVTDSVNDFVRTVPSEKYCCKNNRKWRHFVAMTTPMPLQSQSSQIFVFI